MHQKYCYICSEFERIGKQQYALSIYQSFIRVLLYKDGSCGIKADGLYSGIIFKKNFASQAHTNFSLMSRIPLLQYDKMYIDLFLIWSSIVCTIILKRDCGRCSHLCLSFAGSPLVILVLEGGRDAVLHVVNSIKHGIPVVLFKGTGRAANLLSYLKDDTR